MTVLLTGASSGIGFQAASSLLKVGHNLICPCRDSLTSERTRNSLQKINVNSIISCPIADLSDLFSINNFTSQILEDNIPIDSLVLNAGLQYTGSKLPQNSKQGVELTFAVNHLANFVLIMKLKKLLFLSTKPRVIITSSEVHNPSSSGGSIGKPAGLGSLAGLRELTGFEMVDGSYPFNADKAYKDSKLCNILFGRELARRYNTDSNSLSVIAWAPGLVIPRSKVNFFRYSRKYNEVGQRLFSFLARDIFSITEDVRNAGNILRDLATNPEYDQLGFRFYSNKLVRPGKYTFVESITSREASDLDLAFDLWEYTNNLYSKLISYSD